MSISEEIHMKMQEYDGWLREEFHWFHQHPEASFQEYDTTAHIIKYLKDFGVEILDTGLETGCIGLLKGRREGPCIALRADIDALPVTEASSSKYPSLHHGWMHACGHDTHTVSLLGAVRILSDLRNELAGSVKILFQPAEEINLGAKKMMELRCLENPRVDAIFGMHNSPEIPAGTVAVKKGPLMAAVDRIEITIHGKGGHGGIPQRNTDPIIAAAAVIQGIQTIVSRNISPIDSCVLSLCNIRAGEGTTNNVTPDEVRIYGTVRTFKKEVKQIAKTRLRSIVENTSVGYGCTGILNYIDELEVTDNNPILYDTALQAVRSIGVKPVDPVPSTGGEDFAAYLAGSVPGFFYWLGVKNEKKDCIYSWHSPHFKADENALAIGAGTYAMTAFCAIRQFRKT